MQFADQQQNLREVAVLIALKVVETRGGAERILRAEMEGLQRQRILISAARRLDGFDLPDAVHLNHRFNLTSKEQP